jgi:hypothetical protein
MNPRPETASLQRSLDFADCLIELGEIGDSLAEMWQARRANELDEEAFSDQLNQHVRRLQTWPGRSGLLGERQEQGRPAANWTNSNL